MVLVFAITISCVKPNSDGEKYEEESDTLFLATVTRPLTDVKFESTPERLKRGEYLSNGILACFTCHSQRDSSKAGLPPIEAMKGGGSIISESATERVVAPNISPDKETGAGTWTDDMFSRAIREGIGHDGRALSGVMFWTSFSQLSDEDLASVVVYLKSIRPVKNKLPKRKLTLEKEKELQGAPIPLTAPVKQPNLSDTLVRGRYLVKLGDCVGCHTGWYKRNPGRFGGGNNSFEDTTVFSTNLTRDPTGLGGWTPDLFINAIRTGKEGLLHPAMPWITYRNMTDEDLTAIFRALQRLPPINHRVINAQEATYCEVCEQKHGYGKYNKIVPLRAIAVDTSLFRDYAGTYVTASGNEVKVKKENGKLFIRRRDGKFLELVAVEGNRFQSLDYVFPISFKRDANGKVNQLIRYSLEEESLNKKQ